MAISNIWSTLNQICITLISGYYLFPSYLTKGIKKTILLSAPLHSHISSRISSTQAINNQTLDEEVLQKKKKSVDLLALQFILTQSRWGGRGGGRISDR